MNETRAAQENQSKGQGRDALAIHRRSHPQGFPSSTVRLAMTTGQEVKRGLRCLRGSTHSCHSIMCSWRNPAGALVWVSSVVVIRESWPHGLRGVKKNKTQWKPPKARNAGLALRNSRISTRPTSICRGKEPGTWQPQQPQQPAPLKSSHHWTDGGCDTLSQHARTRFTYKHAG